jgi:hypothetical protein
MGWFSGQPESNRTRASGLARLAMDNSSLWRAPVWVATQYAGCLGLREKLYQLVNTGLCGKSRLFIRCS